MGLYSFMCELSIKAVLHLLCLYMYFLLLLYRTNVHFTALQVSATGHVSAGGRVVRVADPHPDAGARDLLGAAGHQPLQGSHGGLQ